MNNSIKKGVVVSVILLFVSVSVIPSTGINVEKSSTVSFDGDTLYVGGNGTGNYSKIQDAIDNASDGDTVFVYGDSSPYYENVVVNKSINLIGEDRKTTIINGGESRHIVMILADWINIRGFTLTGSFGGTYYSGVYIKSDFNTVQECNSINNEGSGITLFGRNNLIDNNKIAENRHYGIYIVGPHQEMNNTISNNSFIFNGVDGIAIWDGSNCNNDNKIYHNDFKFHNYKKV